jgi:hypothetical protein
VTSRATRRALERDRRLEDPSRVAAGIDGGEPPAGSSGPRAAELAARLGELSVADVDALLQFGSLDYRRALFQFCQVNLDCRFVRRGAGRVLWPTLRRRIRTLPLTTGELLLHGATLDLVRGALGDAFDDPGTSEVTTAWRVVAEQFGERVANAYLACVAASDAPAAERAAEVVDALAD